MDNCKRCIWSGKCSTEGSGLNCNGFIARKITPAQAAAKLLAACHAVLDSAASEDGCMWCDRASNWPHESWCPIPQVQDAVAQVWEGSNVATPAT